jgi:hypothetical protein
VIVNMNTLGIGLEQQECMIVGREIWDERVNVHSIFTITPPLGCTFRCESQKIEKKKKCCVVYLFVAACKLEWNC